MLFSFFENRPYLSWLIVIVIAIAIFYVSSLTFPPPEKPGTDILSILYHIFAFFFLALFLMFAAIRGNPRNKDYFMPAILASLAYGISDELHQFFVPGRFLSFTDIFQDSVGVMFAFMIYWISLEYKNNKL